MNKSLAEIHGGLASAPLFSSVTESWLQVTTDPSIGTTFHRHNGESAFFSYAQLLAESKKVAVALLERGVCPRDRIALMLPTGPEFLTTFFGVLLADAIPAPLYPPMGLYGMKAYQERTHAMLGKLRPRLLITMARLQNIFPELMKENSESLGMLEPQALQGDEQLLVPPCPHPKDIAFVQFSSGTTVEPKPVALSHRNLMANITAIGDHYRELNPNIKRHNFSWLPLYHDMGLIGNLLAPVAWNCRNELLAPQDFVARPWLWLQLISRTGAVLSSAPSFAYTLCVKRVKATHLEGVDLSHWLWALNGAEPINTQAVQAFETQFAPWGLRSGTVVPAYGLAEVSLAASIGKAQHGLQAQTFATRALEQNLAIPKPSGKSIASAGRPLRGTRIRIVSSTRPSEVVTEGMIGEIQIKSDSVMEGYLKPDGDVEPLEEEWLSTGDLGFLHKGLLYICGRQKQLIIQNGRNIYPHHVEETIEKVSGIHNGHCAVVSRPGEKTEEVFAFAESSLRQSTDEAPVAALENEVQNAVLKEHGLRLDYVVLLKKHSLPRTSSGKVRRYKTLQAFLCRDLKTLRPLGYFVNLPFQAKSHYE